MAENPAMRELVEMSPKALKAALKAAGTTATAMSLAIGRDKGYINDYFRGRKESLSATDWQKIASKLGNDQPSPSGYLAESDVLAAFEALAYKLGIARSSAHEVALMLLQAVQDRQEVLFPEDRAAMIRTDVLAAIHKSLPSKAP